MAEEGLLQACYSCHVCSIFSVCFDVSQLVAQIDTLFFAVQFSVMPEGASILVQDHVVSSER